MKYSITILFSLNKIIFFCIVILSFIIISCNNRFLEKKKYKDSASVSCYLLCKEIDSTKLPQIAEFKNDPVLLFKSTYPNISEMKQDSVVHKWNEFVIHICTYRHDMFPKGAALCQNDYGKRWVATTAVIINGSIYMWSKKVTFKKGYQYNVSFNCENKVKF